MRAFFDYGLRLMIAVMMTVVLAAPARAADLTIAAAADLKFAMDEIVAAFRKTRSEATIDVIYGSSGKFSTQIRQGAPFDLYFSADIDYARQLEQQGLAAGPARLYAVGRIVLWSAGRDASRMTLAGLADPAVRRIAMANPLHAPYGKRAEEALRAAGVWDAVQGKLVFGENIAQTAQFVQTGNADVGIVALSLVLNPALSGAGGYHLIDEHLHAPLEQGFIVTRRGAGNALAAAFAAYMESATARSIMVRYGFVLPAATGGKAD